MPAANSPPTSAEESGASPLPPVVRFAPSPTGYLHIGGARTALYNWLFARRAGGRFLLRIEDTDRARSTEDAVEAIYESLRWLGLDWDGDAVHQHSRAGRHAELALGLLEKGAAYRCYATREDLEEMRTTARAEGRPMRYDRRWRDRTPGAEQEGVPFVVRLRAPLSGSLTISDLVRGEVSVQCEEMDDMILLRGDGTPTYMLSVVVDDHDMDVSHVIRGDDHFTNAFRQMILYQALGWEPPTFAHIPLIHGEDGAKLSKRHGAVGTLAYRDAGILPEAMLNCLLRLGWAKGDLEILTRAEAVEHFSLEGVGRSPARFSPKHLLNLNGHHLRAADDRRLVSLVQTYLARDLSAVEEAVLLRAMPGLKTRAEDICALGESARIYLESPTATDTAGARILEKAPAGLTARLEAMLRALPEDEGWSEAALEATLRAYAEGEGLKLGGVAQPLRVAMTGTTTSPPIFEVLAILGRGEVLSRLSALPTLASGGGEC